MHRNLSTVVASISIEYVEYIEKILYYGLTFVIIISPKLFGPIIGSIWCVLFGIGLSCTTIITAHRYISGDVQMFILSNILIHTFASMYLGIMGMFYGSMVLTMFSFMLIIILIGSHMIERPQKIQCSKSQIIWNSNKYYFHQKSLFEFKPEFVTPIETDMYGIVLSKI